MVSPPCGDYNNLFIGICVFYAIVGCFVMAGYLAAIDAVVVGKGSGGMDRAINETFAVMGNLLIIALPAMAFGGYIYLKGREAERMKGNAREH